MHSQHYHIVLEQQKKKAKSDEKLDSEEAIISRCMQKTRWWVYQSNQRSGGEEWHETNYLRKCLLKEEWQKIELSQNFRRVNQNSRRETKKDNLKSDKHSPFCQHW